MSAPGAPLDVRALGWWIALGALAGALAGLLVGGMAGRLLMLALRVGSPDAEGVTTDAGFEIGQVTVSGTATLAALTTLAGALAGIAWTGVRPGLPGPARVPLAALLGATVGGASVIDPDGIDLLILEPTWLAVGGFIALPAIAAGAIALIVERAGRAGRRPVPPIPHGLSLAVRGLVTVAFSAAIVAGAVELAREVNRVV
jgi:hypothetical protein